jgi:vancomycin resistance protein VanJ
VIRLLVRFLAAYCWVAAVLLAFLLVSPVESGPLAVVQLLTPYVALLSIVAAPLAIAARSRAAAFPIVVTGLLFLVRFGGEWASPSATVGDPHVAVATWNMQAGVNSGPSAVALLREQAVDVLALQELTPDVSAAIEADRALTARFPHRVLEPREGVSGAGILSRYPIESAAYAAVPVRLEASLQLPHGELVVIDAHPYHSDLELTGGIPTGMDPVNRNAELSLLRARVAELEAVGSDVLLLGDFNTAPTEPAFGSLTARLHDAHAEAGWGPGWTWRPLSLAFLGIGVLRIDLVLSTDALVPVGTSIHCPPTGDHCLVEAGLTFTDG